ncbi:MAG: PilZ domain-containing protein [Elusimicrobia bacterium]|nr:PilZ domain-containing protein [Elusimicrobiota bacterium]
MVVEQRKYPRVGYVASVDILPTSDRKVLYKGLIKNISLGGIAVETERDLLMGGEFKFYFLLPSKISIKVVGNVVWEYKDKSSNFYGVQFRTVGLISKFKLKRFIDNKLKSVHV